MRPQLNPLILGPGAPWSLPGSSLDLQFTTGRAAVNRQKSSISSLLTTTRASTGYASTSTGSLTLFPANTPRITDLGLLVEQAATNLVLWSRDFTNAVWTKVNATTALDQTGVDNSANSASSLTATGANATILQTPGLASAQRTFSVYVKRITGSGAITITDDGVTYGSDISGSLSTSAWFRTSITATAVPVFGIKMATSGDKIAVDFAQDETGAFATSPILTTTVAVTRAADSVLLAGMALTAAQVSKAAYTQTSGLNQNTSNSNDIMVAFASVGQALRFGGSTIVVADNAANTQASANLGSGTWTGRVKAAFGYDASGYTAIGNDGTRATQAFSWGAITGNVVLGNNAPLSRCINGYLERVAFGSTKGMFDGLTA